MSNKNMDAGTGIVNNKRRTSKTVTDHLTRYVFSPMLQIDLGDRNITGAMSQTKIIKGRIANLEDCPYKIRDESSDMLLSGTNDDEFYNAPLSEHIHTARDQAEYINSVYGIKGAVVIEELTGIDADDVIEIEGAVLPDYIDTVLEMGKYLDDEEAVKANIKKSGISGENLKKAKKIVPVLKDAVARALKFASDWVIEGKAEIINSRNGKVGKTSHDPFEMEMFRQTGLQPLRERDIQYADAQNKAEATGNKELVEAIKALADASKSGDINKEKEAEMEFLKKQVEDMKAMMEKLMSPK